MDLIGLDFNKENYFELLNVIKLKYYLPII